MDMEVILTEDDPKLGRRGEVVKVSRGHALNFLIPHGKARLATPSNLKSFENEKAAREKKGAEELARAEALAEKIRTVEISIEVLTGEGEKLFGAVTAQEIALAAAARGIALEKRHIVLEEPLKKLGQYSIKVKIHPAIPALLKVSVVKKNAAK